MSRPLRLLIVEDSEKDAMLLVHELRRADYEVTFERVDTADAMKSALDNQTWDLVIADYTMPQFRGTEALELLKKSGHDIPFIFVSDTIGEDTAVASMKAGAHDYIIKGNLKRLVPAIERELREAEVRRQRRQAEKGLRESEVHKGAILDAALDCLITIDCHGRIIEFNPAAEKTFDYNRAEAIGKEMSELIIPPSLRERHRRGLAHYLATGEGPLLGKRIEITAIRADGTEFPVEVSIVHIPGSEPPMFTGFIRDITERKRAELEIKSNLERIQALREIDLAITSTLDLRTVLDFLLEKIDLFISFPCATTIRLFNKQSDLLEPVACRNLNEAVWKAEEWKIGRGLANVVFETKIPLKVINVQTDPRTRDQEFFRRYGLVSYLGVPLIAKMEILGVLGLYTKEEHEFTKEEVDFLSTLAGQAAIAILNSQLYEQTKNQALELERANRVKDEFLSVMSHELRTPLNVVMGYTAMIKDGMLGEINPKQEEALAKVISRASDQLAIVNNILYATVMETQQIKAESHAVVLGDFLNQLRSAYEAPLNKELTLNWDCSSPLSVIHTDSAKLKYILQNLIHNAFKFTEKGHVTISARHIPEAKTVEFRVSDTGVGIRKEHLLFIFEKFRQVDSSETRLYGGVGMGLYIVKRFTELLGGTVEVESEPGKGSTFTVTIPCER